MKITRRTFLAGAAVIAGAGALPMPRPARAALFDRQRLRIPELLDARSLGRSLRLTAQAGETAFFPGIASSTLGYNGAYLGPTIRVHDGDDVEIAVANALREPTTVHWHGLLVPGPLDGGPHQEIAPGDTWRPVLPVRQPAATLFYHSHLHHLTGEQVYRGLAGVLIVADAHERSLGLPSEYGYDDIPLVLQDRQFEGGRLVMPGGPMVAMSGRRGDTLLANGTPNAHAEVPARRVRLRLVNGSNARTYLLSFDDRRPFDWIASEGGLLEAPLTLRSIELAPGERREVVVDFSDGRPAALVTAPDANLPMMGMGMMGRSRTVFAAGAPEPVVTFEPRGAAASPAPSPARLAAPLRWHASGAVRRRRFALEMRMMMGGGMMGGRGMGMGGAMGNSMDMATINGRAFDVERIDERVRLGDTEIWEVSGTMMDHPFHVHGVQFQVLRRGGQAPSAYDQGLRDTVVVQEPVELLVRFTQPAREAPFMYHCHILEHEDSGMMGQFTVT